MRTIFFSHAVASVLVTCIILLVYMGVQQTYRTGANDPQIQVARDAAATLKQSGAGVQVVPASTVNIGQSLATFVQVYDEKNMLVQSNGFIYGKAPLVPAGLLAEAKKADEHCVTWQPLPNVRIAAVIVYTGVAPASYVLVGRSLLEVEKRENVLFKMVFMCWLLCMCVICCHSLLQAYTAKNNDKYLANG